MSSVLLNGTGNWEAWKIDNVDIAEETVGDIGDGGVRTVSKGPRGRQSFLPDLENQLLSETVEDEFVREFQPGSLVWAKVTGHSDPAWPARVTRVKEQKGLDLLYRVKFYRTKEWAVLQEGELWPYSKKSEKEFIKLQNICEGSKKRMFEDAVRDIGLEQQASATSLPRIQTVLKRGSRSSPVSLAVFSPSTTILSRDINMNKGMTVKSNTGGGGYSIM